MRLFFGPNFRYFFDDGRGNFRYRATPAFVDLLKSESIRAINHVAFGVGDSFFICYTRANGQTRHYFKHDNHYAALKAWIYDDGLTHDASLYVSLGLNDAFFAVSDQGQRWRNLPQNAEDYYQKFTRPSLFSLRRVNCIDLGYDHTYLGLCVDGGWFWDLDIHYPRFEALDMQRHLPNANFAIISPFAPDQHFVVFRDGTTHFSLPPQWAGDIAQLFQQYAQQTVQYQPPQMQQYGFPNMYGPPQNQPPQSFQPSQSPPAQSPRLQKKAFWRRTSSNSSTTSPPPAQQQQQQMPYPGASRPVAQESGGGSFDVNGAMQLGDNMFDAYSNVTNSGGGGQTNIDQSISMMQGSVDAMNNAAGIGNAGMNVVNQVANTGLLVGQIGGQIAGAAAVCCVM
ncbi:MAG: hypothetical protein Q9202_007448 [Teloschistes flavicans]